MSTYKYYREILNTRAIQENFSSGQINFRWELGENQSFNPSKSFIKFRCKLTKGDETQLDREFGCAPNYYVCDNFFQQISQKINGITVSQMNDYVAQCSTLKNRMFRSQNRKESILSSTNYAQIYLDERINEVSKDGLKMNKIEYQYIPLSELGYESAVHEYSLAILNSRLTFVVAAGHALPDNTQIFKVGDYIRFNNNAGDKQYERIVVVGANTLDFVAGTITQNKAVATLDAGEVAVLRPRPTESISKSLRQNDIELIWKPCLGFWSINSFIPGCGSYDLELTPHATIELQKYAIESIINLEIGNLAANFKFDIIDMRMYLYVNVGLSISSEKVFTYEDIQCTSQNLTTNSLTSKIFSLHENNVGVTLAYQDSNVGNDTSLSRSKFKIHNDEEQLLKRYYIKKGPYTLPDPLPTTINNDDVYQITQRYYENFGYSKTTHLSRFETLQEFIDAGPYFYYEFGKSDNRVNNIQIYSQFGNLTLPYPQLLLFDHYICNLVLTSKDGRIRSISMV